MVYGGYGCCVLLEVQLCQILTMILDMQYVVAWVWRSLKFLGSILMSVQFMEGLPRESTST